jgi:hypothetical protein
VDTCRFTHSNFPDVTLRPWFEGQKEEKKFVCTVSRVLSGNCSVRLHLGTLKIIYRLFSVKSTILYIDLSVDFTTLVVNFTILYC